MNQSKIGIFLKTLRKEKGLTQEAFAEIVNVSNRTVSRWENGNNMPDIDILIEISDYYEVDLREILNGERESEKMEKEIEETVFKAVEYTNIETQRYSKRVKIIFLTGAVLYLIAQLIQHTELVEITFLSYLSDFAEGASCGILVLGFIVTSRYEKRIKDFKQRLFANVNIKM